MKRASKLISEIRRINGKSKERSYLLDVPCKSCKSIRQKEDKVLNPEHKHSLHSEIPRAEQLLVGDSLTNTKLLKASDIKEPKPADKGPQRESSEPAIRSEFTAITPKSILQHIKETEKQSHPGNMGSSLHNSHNSLSKATSHSHIDNSNSLLGSNSADKPVLTVNEQRSIVNKHELPVTTAHEQTYQFQQSLHHQKGLHSNSKAPEEPKQITHVDPKVAHHKPINDASPPSHNIKQSDDLHINTPPLPNDKKNHSPTQHVDYTPENKKPLPALDTLTPVGLHSQTSNHKHGLLIGGRSAGLTIAAPQQSWTGFKSSSGYTFNF